MHTTLALPAAQGLPPRIPPHPPRRIAEGAAEPDDPRSTGFDEELALLNDAETGDGCDFPEGPLSPAGCPW